MTERHERVEPLMPYKRCLVDYERVRHAYRGKARALDDVTLDLRPGELICVLGANGSGKSTLAKLANALVAPQEGVVRVDGLDTRDTSNTAAIRTAVSMVFQSPDDQIVASLVEDDVAFGPCNLGLDAADVDSRVAEALDRAELAGFGKRDVSALSGGQRQRVAIAGALAMRPRAIVFDEASSMLDSAARMRFMQLCRSLADQGLAVVCITHFLDEANQADRVIALDRGRVAIDDAPAAALSQVGLLERIGLYAPFRRRTAKRGADDANEVAITMESASFSYRKDEPPVIRNVSLGVHRGEILGITGLTGSGKSTLVQLMAGILEPTGGSVSRGVGTVGMAFQYPERQLFAATVFDDVAFGPRNLGLCADEVERRVRESLGALHLGFAELRERSPFALSGGQQRRVALAGVLACNPDTLVLDEPTAGLDPRTRTALLELVEELNAKRGITVVMVSHDRDNLRELCDRVITMRDGAIE